MTHFLDLLNVGALEIRTDTGLPSLDCLGESRISTVGRRLSLCCVPDDLVLVLTRLLHDNFLLYNGRRIGTRSHSRGLVLIAGAGLSFAQGGGICERAPLLLLSSFSWVSSLSGRNRTKRAFTSSLRNKLLNAWRLKISADRVSTFLIALF